MEKLELRGVIVNIENDVLEIKPFSPRNTTIKITSKKSFKQGDEVKIEYIEENSIYKISRITSKKEEFQIENIYENSQSSLVVFKNNRLSFLKEFPLYDVIFDRIKKDRFLKAIVFSDHSIMYDIDYYSTI